MVTSASHLVEQQVLKIGTTPRSLPGLVGCQEFSETVKRNHILGIVELCEYPISIRYQQNMSMDSKPLEVKCLQLLVSLSLIQRYQPINLNIFQLLLTVFN